jgi:thimet oligopeptidase
MHNLFAGHQTWYGIGGLTGERDFVEAPSQLLEEWVRDPGVLAGFARHYETGEPIPADLVRRMIEADEFGRGLSVRIQMYYAALSLRLHQIDPDQLDPVAVEAELVPRYTPFRYVPQTYLHLSFGHLDGYSATYYTYMWSLVIAKDLFTAFQSEGLPAPQTAHRYRDTILCGGASAPAATLVQAFLGRDYTAEAYRRWLNG